MRLKSFIAYAFVSFVAVSLAFLFATRFATRSRAQAPPPPPPPAGEKAKDKTPGPPTAADAAAIAAEVQGFLEPFIYEAKGRRDPFLPYAELKAAEPTQATLLSPLQRFDLDELKLIGVMWDIHDPKAMFLDPNKEVHVVSRDEGIGRRNGYLATIREGEVVVVESVRNGAETFFKTKVIRIER